MRKKNQIALYENLKKTSLVFLIITGPIHIISGLLYAQNPFLKTSFLTNRVLDIPLLSFFMIYILSSAKLEKLMANQNSSKYDYLYWSVFITILVLALSFDLFYPAKLPKII